MNSEERQKQSSKKTFKTVAITQKQSSGGVQKKGILKNFGKFKGKHLCQSLIFDKVAGLKVLSHFRKKSLMENFKNYCIKGGS